MIAVPSGAHRLERLYARALRLYPARFQEEYEAAMRQAFHDALADRARSRRAWIAIVARDLITSLCKEHFAMLRETFARPALVFNTLILAGISTVLALALYSIPQQVLRQGANDPQVQLAGDLAARLEQGIAPSDAIPAGTVDMARSLSPFVIAYDAQGRPLASEAQLNGTTPAPPAGVFDYVRQHGEERVTWQPIRGREHGVRIAAVIKSVGGAQPGFGLILAGTVTFGWYTRKRTA